MIPSMDTKISLDNFNQIKFHNHNYSLFVGTASTSTTRSTSTGLWANARTL